MLRGIGKQSGESVESVVITSVEMRSQLRFGFCAYVCHMLVIICCLQCYDAVGWAAGRASGL